MRAPIVILLLLLVACASPREEPSQADPYEVVAAERAFAADAAQHGWAAAFRRHHAPGATVLAPGPVDAAVNLANVECDGETTLDWRPAYAGIARSGDFGFTTGPFLFRGDPRVVGHYFTVWRRQPDGSWKWIFDAGTDVIDENPVAADFAVPVLNVASAGAGSAAIDQVRVIEEGAPTLADLAQWLAEGARVNRDGLPPATSGMTAEFLMRGEPLARTGSLRREASAAGDLVFSMGTVRDQHEGAERLRYFARMWQLQPEGWRIVFDEIVPLRG